ncbi:MAG TPA: bifunctional riboflavin kinase/FAD synthetase [Sphingomonadaceae bacterium]|nr:bifunctional riboflavin kinase/FAD synthetase [Sphingomonadaceae bacterium]
MERLTNATPLAGAWRGAVIALGNFDGFHRGHQAVVARALAQARRRDRPLIVATFDPHPVRFFHPETPPFRLTTLDQRERLFAEAGADAMLVFDFNADLAAATPEDFMAERIVRRTGAVALVTGQDFTFGHGRAGNVVTLARLAGPHRIDTEAVGAVADSGGVVSSSRVRDAVAAGDCATAARLLTRPFTIEGVVRHGDQLGRQMGFPTANLLLNGYIRPAYGIYAVRGRLPDGRLLDGAANLGLRPSFDPPKELLEPYFFDFSGDLYGQTIAVELHAYLRPELRFDGLDALKAQIALDCEEARALLAAIPRVA